MKLVSRLVFAFGLLSGMAWAQPAEPMRARLEAKPGPHFVGEGIELVLVVLGAAERPRVELPRIQGAEVWQSASETKPILTTRIGEMVAQQRVFALGLRVLPARPGTLEVPSITVTAQDRTARSQATRLQVQSVPHAGRPAEFLGGVGNFALTAEVVPSIVRTGQEFEYRIKVTGPAAWGMRERPELGRLARLDLGLRIEQLPDLVNHEPPERSFVYRIRPTKPGEAVLPPIVVAALDPATSRFVSHKTLGVPIRVVAVPSFDPATIDLGASARRSRQASWAAWASVTLLAILVVCGFMALRLKRRNGSPAHGPSAARRYAAQLATQLASDENRPTSKASHHGLSLVAAQVVRDELIRYLAIGIGRPKGALTPDEARGGVAQLTGSDQLAGDACRLAARCDEVLYREILGEASPHDVWDEALGFFRALGQVKIDGE
jgi:hypothetical protein